MPESLPRQLGYTFREPALLRQALTHRSFGAPNNERLEFVGDAVLNCVVGVTLYERFPALPEGDLSRVRAGLVNKETLTRVARRLALGPEILLGDGEMRSGGAQRPSILADALEALYGLVFLDGGFDAARDAIVMSYADVLRDANPRRFPRIRKHGCRSGCRRRAGSGTSSGPAASPMNGSPWSAVPGLIVAGRRFQSPGGGRRQVGEWLALAASAGASGK
jgi:dsRNA-specific ribonuclease